MKYLLSLFFLLSAPACLLMAQKKISNVAPFVIPGLQEWEGGSGYYTIRRNSAIVVEPAAADSFLSAARILQEDLRQWIPGPALQVKIGKPGPGDIFLRRQAPDTSLGQEGYLLNVQGNSLEISACCSRGVFWGTRTLLQVLEQDSLHRRFPCGTAKDYPRYAIRGFVLDDGRKFFSLDFLRKYIKLMAYYKMNDFHIHLNDNGFKKHFNNNWDSTYAAFRLQSDTYPELTSKDGAYTKQEFKDLQALARSYGVNIVPEIDVPAHSLAFSRLRPEIGSKKYGMDHLDLDNPVTYQVIDSIFAEYLSGPDPVFSGPEVHIGTDEYAKEAAEAFRAFTDHYIRLVEHYGKKVRVWGALTHAKGKTPVKAEGVTMNLWYNGYADPEAMKKLGYDLISTPDGWLYIVPAAGYYYDYLNLPHLFEKWEPVQVGDVRFAPGDPQLKGGSFAVWNDVVGNGITEKDVNDRVFPAMQVLSQKMWRGTDSAITYLKFAAQAKQIGESPGLNMRGKYPSKNGVVLHYDFGRQKNIRQQTKKQLHVDITKEGLQLAGGKSYWATTIPEIGYDYAVTFTVKPDRDNGANAVLFSSPNAVVKLQQQQTGKLGFSREGYDYWFDYKVPVEQWTTVTIQGDHKSTSLLVNGKLIQQLEGQYMYFPGTKDSAARVQTLFFPLQYIGDTVHSFKGYIRDLKVLDAKLPVK